MEKKLNYYPGSMSFSEGFLGPKFDVGFTMVADFKKAKEIINGIIGDGRQISSAEMGLDGDWSVNSMTVWEDGVFTEYGLHCSSIWAEPILIVHYKDAPSETYSVWTKED